MYSLKLFRYELRKMVLTQKGWIVLLLCLAANLALVWVLPEQKDNRIKLSQKQYDVYLEQLIGPATLEKEAFIIAEKERFDAVLNKYGVMTAHYQAGEITHDELMDFIREYEEAKVKSSAIGIFHEKVSEFSELKEYLNLRPPEYFYEYGWKSVFTFYGYPNVFLLLIALFVASQVFGNEYASGMANILRVTKQGRAPLFLSKMAVSIAVLAAAGFLATLSEILVMSGKGWLRTPDVPLYSVSSFAGIPLEISVFGGLAQIWFFRCAGVLLFCLLIAGLSVLLKNPIFTFFTGLGIILVPYLLDMNTPYWFTGFVSGREVVSRYTYGQGAAYWVVPLLSLCVYSAAAFTAAYAVFGAPRQKKK